MFRNVFFSGLLTVTVFSALSYGDFVPVAAIPGSGLQGLNGEFWHGVGSQGSIAGNDAYVAANPVPTETFQINQINTANVADSTSLKSFLNSGTSVATNFSAGDGSQYDTHQSYFIFTGYLAVTAAGTSTWNFETNSDDYTQLLINGTTVLARTSSDAPTKTGTAVFDGPGLYAFTLKFSNNGGGIQVIAAADQTGGGNFNPISSSSFYETTASTAAPEPAAWQLLTAGCVLLAAGLRQRKASRSDSICE